MLTAIELTSLKVGDVVDTKTEIFENLAAEPVFLEVTRVSAGSDGKGPTKHIVGFNATYFGTLIGEWVAQVETYDGKSLIVWMDEGEARRKMQ